jgi:hypothetical protein
MNHSNASDFVYLRVRNAFLYGSISALTLSGDSQHGAFHAGPVIMSVPGSRAAAAGFLFLVGVELVHLILFYVNYLADHRRNELEGDLARSARALDQTDIEPLVKAAYIELLKKIHSEKDHIAESTKRRDVTMLTVAMVAIILGFISLIVFFALQ